MCGILGVVNKNKNIDREWVRQGAKLLSHRGPDQYSEWFSDDNYVGFAHRRLSIIDLSELGKQPMKFDNDNLVIIFNGEIYNYLEIKAELIENGYRFSSTSDTEVLLAGYHHWGTDVLNKLNGMFSFAIYDKRKSYIFFARDRVGEKPFFYCEQNGELRFASELKALIIDKAVPRIIDHQSLDCFLSMGFVPNNKCILKGFNKLPAGHAMKFEVNSGRITTWKYWDLPPEFESNSNFNFYQEEKFVDKIDDLLRDSVKRQLIADVPVGILLSGGVDSSLITAMAAQNGSQIKTFTVSMRGYNKYDESPHARLISNHFNTEHFELVADKTSVDLLPILIEQFDEPLVDSSMFPTYLVSQLVSQHCTVALGGDGADELFGGYNHYSKLIKAHNLLRWIPLRLRREVYSSLKGFLPFQYRNYKVDDLLSCDFTNSLPQVAKYFDNRTRENILVGQKLNSNISDDIFESMLKPTTSILQRATRFDFSSYLCEDILVKVDRTSMLNSLEIRAPFLDFRIIEFAFSKLPDSLRATSTNRKVLLKLLAKKILPKEFNLSRKQGFSIPLDEWLKSGDFRDFFWTILTDSNSMFNPHTIKRLFDEHDMGVKNGERLFALVQLQLWVNKYNVSF